jgi:IS1 family transposase
MVLLMAVECTVDVVIYSVIVHQAMNNKFTTTAAIEGPNSLLRAGQNQQSQ